MNRIKQNRVAIESIGSHGGMPTGYVYNETLDVYATHLSFWRGYYILTPSKRNAQPSKRRSDAMCPGEPSRKRTLTQTTKT